jgi:hypothetical protein
MPPRTDAVATHQAAAAAGGSRAQLELGKRYTVRDYNASAFWLLKAKDGQVEAHVYLGFLTEAGLGGMALGPLEANRYFTAAMASDVAAIRQAAAQGIERPRDAASKALAAAGPRPPGTALRKSDLLAKGTSTEVDPSVAMPR